MVLPAVWNPEGNPSSQGSVSANEVCCKVKAGLLPQIRKGVEGTPTFQESPNSDFLSDNKRLKAKKKKGKQPLGLATSKGKVEQASLELIRSSLESHKAH